MVENIPLITLSLIGLLLLIGGFWLLRKNQARESDIASIMYSLTHDELSNPVQSALATVDNLESRITHEDAALHHDIGSLKKSLTRLAETTRNLRALVLLDLPRTSRASERVNIVGLVQRLIIEHGIKADKEDVKLVYEGGDSPIHVLVKPQDLERVISNLIDNGIKYRSAVEQGCVVVSVTRHKRKVQIDISDNGVGISKERLQTLGQAPQRPDAKNIGTRGAGLGLFLTKKIVESYQGAVSVSSTENRGTTVSISLPLHAG